MPKFLQQPYLTLGALAVLAMPCSARANFISGGLEWLNVTDSINISFPEMQAELQPGGMFEGFRHASLEETWTLASNFAYDTNLTLKDNATAVQDLQDALGTTFASSAGTLQFSTLGYIDDGTRFDIVLRLPDPGDETTFLGEIYQTDLGFLPEASPLIGHYLVRPIPEPGQISVILGIAVLLYALRRQAHLTIRFNREKD